MNSYVVDMAEKLEIDFFLQKEFQTDCNADKTI